MKTSITLLAALVLGLLSVPAVAQDQGRLSLDHVDGLLEPEILAADQEITFHVRVINNTSQAVAGITNGFVVYSNHEVQWTATTPDTTGALGKTQFDGFFFINEFSTDGQGADTVGFGGTRMVLDGMPAGFDDIAYTITIGPIPIDYAAHQICLDSAYYPPTGYWKWASPGIDFYPEWDGPLCFWIDNSGPCFVLIDNPPEGEALLPGQVYTITWFNDCGCNVKLEFSSVGGDEWATIAGAEDLDTTVTSFNWVVPDTPTMQAQLRICCTDESRCDVTDNFAIAAPGILHVPEEFASIQTAMDLVLSGGTVVVGPGTYAEHLNFRGKAIRVTSSGGRDVTIIEREREGAALVVLNQGEDTSSILEGFTIRNALDAPGIFCNSASPLIQDCDIYGNSSTVHGGGLYVGNSEAVIRRNLIHDNVTTETGGGIGGQTDRSLQIYENEIFNNEALHGPGIGFLEASSNVDIHHNVIWNNTGLGYSAAGIFLHGTNGHIHNNTIVGNSKGIRIQAGNGVYVVNNIIVSNLIDGIIPGAADVAYNCVWNNPYYNNAGENGISADPLFVDPDEFDYRLQTSSPCINAGDPDPVYFDQDGSRNDIGAYAVLSGQPLPTFITLVEEDHSHVLNHTPLIRWVFYDTSGNSQVGYHLEVGTDQDWTTAEMWSTGEFSSGDSEVVYGGAELLDGVTYYLRARVNNGTIWGEWNRLMFHMNAPPSVPVPLAPVANADVHPDFVTLRILNATDTEEDDRTYDFEVYEDAASTILAADELHVLEQNDSTETQLIPNLVEGQQYYWRARACDAWECSDWSAVESFTARPPSQFRVPDDFATIQAAIDQVPDGAVITVAPGIYVENINFHGRFVKVTSSHGRDHTFIQAASGHAPVVTFDSGEDHRTILNGFTIRGTTHVYGVYCHGSGPIIQNCDISFCVHSGDGAGIWCRDASAVIRYNRIHDNRGGLTGGGVGGIGTDTLEIAYNDIYNNIALHGSGIGFISPTVNLNIHHNLIYNNTGSGGYAGGIYVNGQNFSIVNNTIDGNTRGVRLYDGTNAMIRNNIITNCQLIDLEPVNATNIDHNDLWGNGAHFTGGMNNFSADPLYFDPENGDYTLRYDSPCIDAGNPEPQYNDPDGSRNDLGYAPFVFGQLGVVAFQVVDEDPNHVINHTPTFAWLLRDPTVTQSAFEFEVGSDPGWDIAEMWATGEVVSSEQQILYAGAELVDGVVYFVRVRVSDGQAWGDWAVTSFRMNSRPTPPDPLFPIDNEVVHAFYVHLSVANALDAEYDSLSYDFELYEDDELNQFILSLPGIPEQPDSTLTDVLDNVPAGLPVWWRARANDGYEYSEWAPVQSFVTRGPVTIRVPSDQPTIAEGIAAAVNGDIVVVDPGYYLENLVFGGKEITVTSSEGPSFTFVQPQYSGPIVLFTDYEGPESRLSGFTFQYSDKRSAVYIENASPEVHHNVFYMNSDNQISDFTPVRVTGNSAEPMIHHNLFDRNGGVANVYISSPAWFYNNTIVNSQRAGIIVYNSDAVIRNNIVIGCPAYGFTAGSHNPSIGYNDFYGNNPDWLDITPGPGSIQADPLFVDFAAGNYELTLASPCINAGDPHPMYTDPDGSTSDMGAFPFNLLVPLAKDIWLVDEDRAHVVRDAPTIAWSYFDTLGPQTGYLIEVGTDSIWTEAEMWSSGEVTSSDSTAPYDGNALVDGESYYLRLRVTNGTDWGGWSQFDFRMNTPPTAPTETWPQDSATIHLNYARLRTDGATDAEADSLWYDFEVYDDSLLTTLVASQDAVPEGDDGTWSDPMEGLTADYMYWWRVRAFDGYEHSDWTPLESFTTRGPGTILVPQQLPTIQDGIDAAGPRDTVLVAPGVYTENLRFRGFDVIVRSSHGCDRTFLRPDQFHAVTVAFYLGEGEHTYFGGFTVENGGLANTMLIESDSRPTVAHNVFRNNIPDTGSLTPSVILAQSPAVITRNVFYLNGGSYCISAGEGAQLINNTFVENHAGLFCDGAVVLNNIVVYNDGAGLTGVFDLMDYNLVWHNASPEDPGLHGLRVDPLFVDAGEHDYSLRVESPCIGAGHPDPIYNDYDGTRNDIGAIPYPPPGSDQVIPTTEWIMIYCADPVIDELPLTSGEVVRAYDPNGVLCGVDTVRADGSFGFMPIYADDPLTAVDEGAQVGDSISFRIDQRRLIPETPVLWTAHNATFEVCRFIGEQCVQIELVEGWNLISWNIQYGDSVRSLVEPLLGCLDVMLGFDQGALAYDPDLEPFSTLLTADYYGGYWLRMDCLASLSMCGELISVNDGIALGPGWNLISYWPDHPMDVDDALLSVRDQATAAMGYDDGGMIWMPGDSIHGDLTVMTPLSGYWLHLSGADTLRYPGYDGAPRTRRRRPLAASGSGVVASRECMMLYGSDIRLDGLPLRSGVTIEAVAQDSILCGAGVYEDGRLKLTPVYGYDPLDQSTNGYPQRGDRITLMLDGRSVGPDLTWTAHGARVELTQLHSKGGADLSERPDRFALSQNHPNPFNASTVIQYQLPVATHVTITIHNVLGREVTRLVSAAQTTGFHQVIWDGTNSQGKSVASGVYFYRIKTEQFTQSRKMVLLK